MTRAQIQEKINMSEAETFDQLRMEISTWLDEGDLSREELPHEFIKERILNDLKSYEGVPE